MKIQLKRSNVLVENNARQPTAGQMEYGELAVNYNTTDPAIFIKDSNNNIIRIAGKYNIADDGQVELPATPTPPADPKAGNLWYNNTDGRLYIYYTDEDTSQWVDASPDSWDPSSYPDVSDDSAQSGTLDDRYLMLNADNSPVTGTCEFSDGVSVTGNNLIVNPGNIRQGTLTAGASASGGVWLNEYVRVYGNLTDFPEANKNDPQPFQILAADTESDNKSVRLSLNASGSAYFAGNVGIGTDNPLANLEVANTSGSVVSRFTSKNDSSVYLQFADTDDTNAGEIRYSHADDSMRFRANDAERMRIDKDGNVGIGTSDPQAKLDVAATGDGAEVIRLSTDRPWSFMQKGSGSSSTLALQTTSDNKYFSINGASGTELAQFRTTETDLNNSTILLAHNGGNVGIGTASPNDKLEVNGNIRFTAAGQGINFNNYGSGANIKSNLLDDYEEGTWTPTIVGGITNPVLQAATAGNYTKIGNVVTFNCDIRVQSGTPNSGNFTIRGLPFSAANIPGNFGVASQTYGNIIVALSNQRQGHISPNNSTIVFYDATTIITGDSPNLNWATGRRIILTGTYLSS